VVELVPTDSGVTLDAGIEELVAAAGTIPGWTVGDDAKAVALASLALPERATIVEVGVYFGRCTALLAGARRLRGNGMVHCVDPFDGTGDSFSMPHYAVGLSASGFSCFEEAFRHNVERLGLAEWVTVHRGRDVEVARKWSDPVDLLLLDGDQSPRGARAEYEAWVGFLRPGGTIILRNTRDREYAPGHDGHRRLMIEELVPPRWREVLQVGATTFAVKQESAAR
jgi:MMP 1-O-methyltransferase